MFDKNLLFLSAFGSACNMAVRGGAVDEKFDRAFIDNAVAPWCSATPLSGELLQISLDALLQNDINLLSAYPDAYVSQSYDGTKAHNGEQFCYFPAGDGQGIETGEDTWNNSVTLSATIGSITGPNNETSGVVLGSLVPAYPFQHGKEWNYGIFGVSAGAPTWYNIDVSALDNFDISATTNVLTSASKILSGLLPECYLISGACFVMSDNAGTLFPTQGKETPYFIDKSTQGASIWRPSPAFMGVYGPGQDMDFEHAFGQDAFVMVEGNFKAGDIIEFDFDIKNIYLASGNNLNSDPNDVNDAWRLISTKSDCPTEFGMYKLEIPAEDDPDNYKGEIVNKPYVKTGQSVMSYTFNVIEWEKLFSDGSSKPNWKLHINGSCRLDEDYSGKIGPSFRNAYPIGSDMAYRLAAIGTLVDEAVTSCPMTGFVKVYKARKHINESIYRPWGVVPQYIEIPN